MAKSKYEFKKFKKKSLPAKIVDSTAVRVLAAAAKKLGIGWKKFVTYSGATFTNIKDERAISDMERITAKIEENQALINTIKKDLVTNITEDKDIDGADLKVMDKARAENERLEAKLTKLLNKNVKLATKKGESVDLEDALNNGMG